MGREWTPLFVLGTEVTLDGADRVHEDFGRDAVEELLDALSIWPGVDDVNVQIARRVGIAANDRPTGDDAQHVETLQDEGDGVSQGLIILLS